MNIKLKYKCENCDKEKYSPLSAYLKREHHFCGKECYDQWQNSSISVNCDNCNKEIRVTKCKFDNNEHFYCSVDCYREYISNNVIHRLERYSCNCENCGKELSLTETMMNKSKYHFCDKNCYDYWAGNKTEKECKVCNIVKPTEDFIKGKNTCKMCEYLERNELVQCNFSEKDSLIALDYIINQRSKCIDNISEILDNKNLDDLLFFIESNTLRNYNIRIKVNCDYCGKDKNIPLCIYKSRKYHLCDKECHIKWHTEIYCKTEEHKEMMRRNAIKYLSSDNCKMTLTKPHIKINEILHKLNISNNNGKEKAYTYYSCDVYMDEYKLPIEINGTFWHCDNRVYDSVDYVAQVNRIRIDKAKHTYIKNEYDVELLYLWEDDINNNLLLCEKLILLHINNKGILENYHSFNYNLNENEELVLNDDVIIPYSEWDIVDLNKIIDLSVKEKVSRINENIWTTIDCDYCGKEIKMLKSDFNRTLTHCCSRECANKLKSKNKTVSVMCNNCKKPFVIDKQKYENSKTKLFYCDRKCYSKKTSHRVEFKCEFCGKENSIKKSAYKEGSRHFCNRECSKQFDKENKVKNELGQFTKVDIITNINEKVNLTI